MEVTMKSFSGLCALSIRLGAYNSRPLEQKGQVLLQGTCSHSFGTARWVFLVGKKIWAIELPWWYSG